MSSGQVGNDDRLGHTGQKLGQRLSKALLSNRLLPKLRQDMLRYEGVRVRGAPHLIHPAAILTDQSKRDQVAPDPLNSASRKKFMSVFDEREDPHGCTLLELIVKQAIR